jgi:uncharacterized protein
MNSCAYTCTLRHDRPNKNRFKYKIYMYYLDLDELNDLSKNLFFFSYNKWNLFSFLDKDHFIFVRQKGKPDKIARETFNYTNKYYVGKNTKQKVEQAIKELNLGFQLGKVYLLTNLRNLGYIFNPVSFYYCYDQKGKLRALLSEVNNTFRDQKLFHAKIKYNSKKHYDKQKKNFYVSPFIDTDNEFIWDFNDPGDQLIMKINSVKKNTLVLKTNLTGNKKKLSNISILMLFFRYPMMPLMAMGLIHWQALKLWFKRVNYRHKDKSDDEIIKRL